jgi:hypothetical protein
VDGISPNTHLSHYQILSKRGAGGRNEVYPSQDTSELSCTAALKTKDDDWFSQEIKVDPFMAPLRDDPPFNDFEKRLGSE